MRHCRFYVLALLLAYAGITQAGGPDNRNHLVAYSVAGAYEDVRFDIMSAIAERGLVVNNISHIGNMLERTGRDLGEKKLIYLKAEALEFCSASISRATMSADPFNIVFCPYILTLFVTPDQPDIVNIAFRKPVLVGSEDSRKALQAVFDLLDGIAREAAE